MNLAQINVYRMTHINNVPHILLHGITHRNSLKANPDFVSIGDVSLIGVRNIKKVWVDNGKLFDSSAPQITLGDFIPFYFGVKMPMLYVVQHGGNFVPKPTPAEDIIYLVCSVQKIAQANINFYFSDGHGTDRLVTFYDKSKIDELPTLIDWKSVTAPYWGGDDNLELKQKKQAEFLVASDLPPDFIFGFGCYNESARKKLLDYGINDLKIKVIPRSYFQITQ